MYLNPVGERNCRCQSPLARLLATLQVWQRLQRTHMPSAPPAARQDTLVRGSSHFDIIHDGAVRVSLNQRLCFSASALPSLPCPLSLQRLKF